MRDISFLNNALRYFPVCLLLILSTLQSKAQIAECEFYDLSDGLASNCVFRMVQPDVNGFIWIGTDNGLARFNGEAFKNYLFNGPVNSNSILAIHPLSEDSLLLSYYRQGTFIFSNDTLHPYPFKPALNQKHFDDIPKALEHVTKIISADEQFWVINASSLYRVSEGRFKRIDISGNPMVNSLAHYKDHVIAATNNGIYQVTAKGFSEKVWPQDDIGLKVWDIALDENGTLYLASEKGVFMLDKGSFRPVTKKVMDVRNLLIDRDGALWISTQANSLYKMHNGNMDSIILSKNNNRFFVNDLMQDGEGNVWLASMADGICRMGLAKGIELIKTNSEPSLVKSVYERSNDELWAGAFGKVYRRLKGGSMSLLPSPLIKDELVMAISELHDSEYMLISTSHHTYTWHPDSGWEDLNIFGSLSQVCDSAGLWIGSYMGLMHFDSLNASPTLIKDGIQGLMRDRINTLYQDTQGNLWIGTDKGLFIRNAEQLKRVDAPFKSRVSDVLEDDEGVIYVATQRGVFQWSNDKWIPYHQLDKLNEKAGNICIGIAKVEGIGICIVTNKGFIATCKGKVLQAIDLSRQLGIDGIYSMCHLRNGMLLLGTLHGLLLLDPKTLIKDQTAPIPYFESISSTETALDPDEAIRLPYHQNQLEINFGSIGFSKMEPTQFGYRLGKKAKWKYTKNQSITYEALTPGTYTFQLKTTLGNEATESKIIQMNFEIVKPFWMKTWALFLAICLFIGLATSLFLLRLKAIKRKNDKLVERQNHLANLKHQALNAMMNPHFITNSLYAISQMSIAKNNKVEQYVSNFSQLVRKNLEDAKHRNIPLDQELQKLQYYVEMEQTRLKNSFAFSIEVDPSVDPEEIEVPNMLLQPLVENAIWHGMPSDGKNGSIVLHITTKNMSTLEITLVDNGEGYANTNPEKSTQRSSFGLRLIREKLSLHHPENHFLIETLDDGNITGTKVTIVLRTL